MGSTLNGGSIRLLWDVSDNATVTITNTSGAGAAFTVDGAAVTFPYTLSASTTFATDQSGRYEVSVLHHGIEVADTPDGTRMVNVGSGSQEVFAPTPDGVPTAQFTADLHAEMAVDYGWRALSTRQPAKQSPPLSDATLITRFDTGHGWTAVGDGAASGVHDLNSSDRPFIGGQSLKYSGDAAGTLEFEKAGLALDLTGRELCIWARVEDYNSPGWIVFLGDATYANLQTYTVPSSEFSPEDGWVCIKIDPRNYTTKSGTLNLALVERMKIRIADPGVVHTEYISAVGHVAKNPTYPNGVVTLTFDDSPGGVLLRAAPLMQDYGYPGVIYAIGEESEGATAQNLSIDNLHRLEDLGWEVGGHADRLTDHVELTTLTDAQVDDTLRRLKAWLVSNGFRGEHLAYPYGSNSAAVREVARRYFATGRTVAGSDIPGITQLPAPTNRLFNIKAPSFDTAGFTLTNMMDAVTKANTHGMWCPLIFHAVAEGASVGPSIGTDDLSTLLAHINTLGMKVVTLSTLFGQ